MSKQRQDAWSEENDLLLAETVLRHVREGSTQLNAFEEVGDKLNRTSAACGFRWNAVVRHQYEKALALAKKQRKQRMRALGNGQPAKKRLLYQPQVEETVTQEEFSQELEPAKEETFAPAAETAEQLQFVDQSYNEELASLSHLLSQAAPAPNTAEKKPEANPFRQHQELTMDDIIDFLRRYEGDGQQSTALRMENSRLKRENNELSHKVSQLEAEVKKLEKDQLTIQEDYETLVKIMNRARKLVLFEEDDSAAPTFKMDRNGNLEKMAE
ncbi:RsfA family transcriptional regulator [Bacillus safensis]|uniref:Prespore-specific transcriptional regulator RsfA n=1 Tax=Bacillus safensis TaxID=561879 RepID=A0A498TZ89_BACIA|nr:MULTISPECIES: RsfA family transcriptional regulator [Bacillus]MBG9819817.1 Prespore-specific transcriptional regulator RsfA [Bacillus safensis]MBR0612044.1 RsfA family transcriptional regulator [Bacillus safensis]MBR0633993.1 RsfA family transcriptional regulator [Bacillus safensis]MDI0191422.1 RsfA family transcriptional regulator [Bacillus safensis]MEC1414212.1 RsfA family transcriptional regulator [Bacillus safensis]